MKRGALLVWHADVKGGMTSVNQHWIEFTGRSLDEALGIGWHESVYPDDLEPYFTLYNQALQEKDAFNTEIRLKHANGNFHWFLVQGLPQTDENGTITQVIGSCFDITDQKQIETHLRENEQQLRALLANMPVMLVASDENQNLLVWNHECENVTGYKAEELLGTNQMINLLLLDEAERQEKFAQWQQFGGMYHNWEIRFICKDGSIKYIEWSNISRQFPISGWASWAVGVDVTSHKRAQQRVELLQQIAEGYAQALTTQDVATTTIERAFTPLNASIGSIGLIDEKDQTLRLVANNLPLPPSEVYIYDGSILARAVYEAEPIWIPSLAQASDYSHASFAVNKLGLQAAAALPLIAGGRIIGGLSLGFNQPQIFDEEQKLLVKAVAQQCAQALERAQLFDRQQEARLDAERTTKRLLSLQTVAGALSSTLTIKQVGQVIVDQACEILGARTGTFQILHEEDQMFEIIYFTGGQIEDIEQAKWRRYPLNAAFPSTVVIQQQKPLWFESGEAVIADYPVLTDIAQIHNGASALVPLIVDNKALGLLSFVFAERRVFDEGAKEVVLALAHQCAQALQRARLHEREREIVKTNERQRLARDLHDAVSQVLFSATARAEVIPRIWQRDTQAAFEQLGQVVKLNRAAMAELRTLLYELRPESITKGDWITQLQHLLTATQSRREVEINLVSTGDKIPLPDDVHYALYRIAQEGLHNVIKHSFARHIDVYCDTREDHLLLRIVDDGAGFDPVQSNGGMGLSSMQERASSIGASFMIKSAPGEGTQLHIQWPR